MGEDIERESVQAVAGKDRRSLAEFLVNRSLSAPQLGIVHARQIVMDQRIDVDRFDRAADPKRALAVDRKKPRCGDGQQRPKALASADRPRARASGRLRDRSDPRLFADP
jgi:hypothetical protein